VSRLRKEARGRECQIRAPGVCNGDPDTVVLCHVRMIGISGMGHKANDLLGAHGCGSCHSLVDGQGGYMFTKEERRLLLLEGVIRTIAILIDEGKVAEKAALMAEVDALIADLAEARRFNLEYLKSNNELSGALQDAILAKEEAQSSYLAAHDLGQLLAGNLKAAILAKEAAEVRAVMWEEGAKELRRRLDTVRGEHG
jgi:hypothetical protein